VNKVGFGEWLQTFIEEKELTNIVFEFENNFLQTLLNISNPPPINNTPMSKEEGQPKKWITSLRDF